MKTLISIVKDKLSILKSEAGNDIQPKDMNILDHIEKIVEMSNKYGINKSIQKGKIHFDYVNAKLGINSLQSVVFSQFMERCNDNNILISEIAKALNCSIVRIIKCMKECEVLEKKRLIRCSRGDNGTSYRVPREVRDSLLKNNDFTPEKIDNLSIKKLFYIIERIFKEKANNEISSEIMKMELFDLINQNIHLEFCQKIMSYKFEEDTLVLLICFCHLYGNNKDDSIMESDLTFLYDEEFDFSITAETDLNDGSHILMKNNLVEFKNDGGFGENNAWKLTDKAKNELLAELNNKRNYKRNLILFDSIKPKKMYYNSKQNEEIQKLISLLQKENFCKIQDRLDKKGMRKGFACLFSGGPGTGKTETAYQIARETQRNIMMVDISETKSMWFGESEKKIKEIFNTYKAAVENSEVIPILLINEADAIIGQRTELNSSSRSVDQTCNTIQNIILQEIENLTGILIATTNLTQNMDSAFERRFLYKINFEKPGIESRNGIWTSLLPELHENSARELSTKYDLSGGQIENITRKIEVDAIIDGEELLIEKLALYCKDEISNGFSTEKKIGF